MVEAAGRVIAMDGDAKRNRLAFARVLAGERDGVGITRLGAFGLCTQGTAIHLALRGHRAVRYLGALGALPLHQLVRTGFGVLGFLVIGARHGPCVIVARRPATGLIRQLHLCIREHHGRLDLVFLVALVCASSRSLEGQADIEVAGVIGSLHRNGVIHGLGSALGLHVLARQTLEVEIQCALLFVATNAGLALFKTGGTAVVGLLTHPLHGRDAWVENMDVALGHFGPVRRCESSLRTHSQQRAQKHHGKRSLFHR